MHRFLDHGRLPVMNSDWLPRGADNHTGTGWVLGGRYRLISQVGAGGMAVVWEAYDSVLTRTVAVKVLAARYADDPQSRDRIRREAQAAAILSHPNIAQVYDYGEADVAGEILRRFHTMYPVCFGLSSTSQTLPPVHAPIRLRPAPRMGSGGG
jgi:serine/threonine protein kinase